MPTVHVPVFYTVGQHPTVALAEQPAFGHGGSGLDEELGVDLFEHWIPGSKREWVMDLDDEVGRDQKRARCIP